MMHARTAAAGTLALTLTFAVPLFAQEPDQLPSTADLSTAGTKTLHVSPNAHQNGQAHARFGIPDIDSLVNYNGHFFADGFDDNGDVNREWYFNTVGNPPQLGGTTTINAPIIPVVVQLLDTNGSIRVVGGKQMISDPAPFVQPVLNSPVFQNAAFTSSSTPTQFTDAVQRAEYDKKAKDDWHTVLAPSVKTKRTMKIPRGKYAFALNPDGTCCRFILVDADTFVNLLFPATADDTTTPIGAAENAGDMTTKDISTLLFPNTFLFVGNTSNCCILGFHSYDFEPGDAGNKKPEKRYVMDYSSWISPGLFGGGFADVTALSHEIAEIYNDPFVVSDGIHDLTPWWLSPNGNCQNDLETGDVIEGLPNGTFAMTMNGMTYHPQNEALLQWFEFESPSSALGGAYSYPDTTVLPHLSAPQQPHCK